MNEFHGMGLLFHFKPFQRCVERRKAGKKGNERQMEGIGWKEGVKERRRQEPTSKKKEGRLGEGGDGEGRG